MAEITTSVLLKAKFDGSEVERGLASLRQSTGGGAGAGSVGGSVSPAGGAEGAPPPTTVRNPPIPGPPPPLGQTGIGWSYPGLAQGLVGYGYTPATSGQNIAPSPTTGANPYSAGGFSGGSSSGTDTGAFQALSAGIQGLTGAIQTLTGAIQGMGGGGGRYVLGGAGGGGYGGGGGDGGGQPALPGGGIQLYRGADGVYRRGPQRGTATVLSSVPNEENIAPPPASGGGGGGSAWWGGLAGYFGAGQVGSALASPFSAELGYQRSLYGTGTMPEAALQALNLERQRAMVSPWLGLGLTGLGAAVGSVVPGLGTMAGAAVGAGVAGVASGLYGQFMGNQVADQSVRAQLEMAAGQAALIGGGAGSIGRLSGLFYSGTGPDALREQANKMGVYAAGQAAFPGLFSPGDVQNLYAGTYSSLFPTGNRELAAGQIGAAGRLTATLFPELARGDVVSELFGSTRMTRRQRWVDGTPGVVSPGVVDDYGRINPGMTGPTGNLGHWESYMASVSTGPSVSGADRAQLGLTGLLMGADPGQLLAANMGDASLLRGWETRLTDIRLRGMGAGYGVGTAQAGLSTAQAQGAGYQTQVQLLTGIHSALERQLSVQSEQLSIARENLSHFRPGQAGYDAAYDAYAQAQAAAAQTGAAAQASLQQRTQVEISQRSGILGTALGAAGLGVQRAQLMGRGPGAIEAALGLQGRQSLENAAETRQMASMPYLDPVTRAGMLLQAQSDETQGRYGIPRQQAEIGLQYHMAEAGLTASQAQTAVTQAQLFGGAAQYGAALRGTATGAEEQIQALSGYRSRLRASGQWDDRSQEAIDIARQINDLRRQELDIVTQSVRQADQMALSVAQTLQSAGQSGYSQAVLQGAGGTASNGAWMGTITGAQGTLDAATKRRQDVENQLKAAGVPASQWSQNPDYASALASESGARLGMSQADISGGNIPIPIGMQRTGTEIDFSLNMSRHAFMPFANQQVLARQAIGNIGQEIQATDAEYSRRRSQIASSHPEDLPAFDYEHERQRMGLMNQGLGYMDQAREGWQDRLLAGVVNAPGTFGFLASQFSRREAAPYLQAFTGQYGMTSQAAQQGWMGMGNFMTSFMGRNGGFTDTALATGGATPVQIQGPIHLEGTITMIDPKTGTQTTGAFRAVSSAAGSGALAAGGVRTNRGLSQNG